LIIKLEKNKITVILFSINRLYVDSIALIKLRIPEIFLSKYKHLNNFLLVKNMLCKFNATNILDKTIMINFVNDYNVRLHKFLVVRKKTCNKRNKNNFLSKLYFSFISYIGKRTSLHNSKHIEVKNFLKYNISIPLNVGNDVSFIDRLVGLKSLIYSLKLFVF
jgi:hypothetical protein